MDDVTKFLNEKHENIYFVMHNKVIICEINDEKVLYSLIEGFLPLGARFCAITCYKIENGHELIYHFDVNQRMVNLKIKIQNSEIESITPIFKAADWSERELSELYGINIKNHPNLKRLFLDEEIKDSVLNEYFTLSNAMNGKVTKQLWAKVKREDAK